MTDQLTFHRTGELRWPLGRALRHGLGLALLWLTSGLLVACGGGGGDTTGGGMGGGPAPVGALTVEVTDSYGAPVPGASVSATLGEATVGGQTDAKGLALLVIDWPSGTAQIEVRRDTFEDSVVRSAVTGGAANTVEVTLTRVTAPAGGALLSRSGFNPTIGNAGRELTFEVEIAVVNGDSQPVEGLAMADFSLLPCNPDATNEVVDCLRGSAGDQAYTPLGTAIDFQAVPGEVAASYAAALLVDQSGSIAGTDPTAARLYSAKSFMENLGDRDQVLLAAFADGTGAAIATPPLTVFGEFRGRDAIGDYFDTLDALAPQVGGGTPLYDAIDAMRERVVGDANLASDLRRAVIVFTDGSDTTCADAQACSLVREQTVAAAKADGVRLFTIGLSSGIDVEALGELALETGGAMLYADSAEQLIPLYGTVGRLLSLSLSTYRLRWTVQAAADGTFQPGQLLIGKVRVNVQGKTLDVPFAVPVT